MGKDWNSPSGVREGFIGRNGDNVCLIPGLPLLVPEMPATPSKDYKRQERELKKAEKRMARDAAKAESKAAAQSAEESEPKPDRRD